MMSNPCRSRRRYANLVLFVLVKWLYYGKGDRRKAETFPTNKRTGRNDYYNSSTGVNGEAT